MNLSRRFGDALDPDEWERRLDEPTFTRRPRRLAPIVYEPSSSIVDVHFRDNRQPVPADHGYAPRLNHTAHWTTAQPTAPGFYFCRARGEHRCTVVRVFATADGSLAFGWSDIPALPVTAPGLEWGSVPLVVPADMEATA